MGGDVIVKDEKALVLECKNLKEFSLKYIQKFGFPERPSRIRSIWADRKAYRDEMSPKPVAQGRSTVLSPSIIDEESVAMSHISDKLSQLIELQKESNKMSLERLTLMKLAMPKEKIVINNASTTDEEGKGKAVREGHIPDLP